MLILTRSFARRRGASREAIRRSHCHDRMHIRAGRLRAPHHRHPRRVAGQAATHVEGGSGYGGSEKFQTDAYWKDHLLLSSSTSTETTRGSRSVPPNRWTGAIAELIGAIRPRHRRAVSYRCKTGAYASKETPEEQGADMAAASGQRDADLPAGSQSRMDRKEGRAVRRLRRKRRARVALSRSVFYYSEAVCGIDLSLSLPAKSIAVNT